MSHCHFRVLGGHQAGEVHDHFGLFPGGIVLHLAVDHDRAGAVGHGGEDFPGKGDLGRIGRKHPLGDRYLARMQRPCPGAAHEEGVTELDLAGVGV